MIMLFVIMPLILAAATSISMMVFGMTAATAFLAGTIICATFGVIYGLLSSEFDNKLYFSIVEWMAAGYSFIAWIITLAINYYAG